ncbi:MAG TPA: hypothetical protein VFE17_10135 [Candidatus Baltobacteraceae bacterium]|nr:hypothetical protein [Candidatus Baltobacteraceae bacterium]
MRGLGVFWCSALLLGSACSGAHGGLPRTAAATRGEVQITFRIPFAPAASTARKPQYFSPSTTAIALALKTENGLPPSSLISKTFQLSQICQQSGSFFYCSTTLSVPSGDDVIGVLAYAGKALNGFASPVPLSFAEGEIVIGSGSSAEPAGADDPTGRLSVILAPVILGGQAVAASGSSTPAQMQGITLNEFIDPGKNVIPSAAYQAFPPLANTPYLTDSDTSGNTSLEDVTTGISGASIGLSSPSDQIELLNGGKERAGQKINGTLKFTAAQTDATFSIPAYFGLKGSVTANVTIPPPGATAPLTFTCGNTGCVVSS